MSRKFDSLLQQPATPQTDGSEIWQTPSAKFTTPDPESLALRAMTTDLAHQISLGWSHYVTLLTIDNPEERRFYEVEAAGNKNDAVVELTLPEEANIYASKYQLYLPSKQELVAQLESIQRELNGEGEDDE